jgi:hypothetical protein
MLALLDALWTKLPPRRQRARERFFEDAREFVRRAAASGGVDAPVSKSFPRRTGKDGIRVDLEVKTGRACVPDPD